MPKIIFAAAMEKRIAAVNFILLIVLPPCFYDNAAPLSPSIIAAKRAVIPAEATAECRNLYNMLLRFRHLC